MASKKPPETTEERAERIAHVSRQIRDDRERFRQEQEAHLAKFAATKGM